MATPNPQQTPVETRVKRQTTLFVAGSTLIAASIFLTRSKVLTRRVSSVPVFYPSNAHLIYPGRLHLAANRAAAGLPAYGGGDIAKVKMVKGTGDDGTFLEGMVRPFLVLRPLLPTQVGDWLASVGKTTPLETPSETSSKPTVPVSIPTQNTFSPPQTSSSTPFPHTLSTMHLLTIPSTIHPTLARLQSSPANLAAEAFALATLNVIAFAIFFTAGTFIALDISHPRDLKWFARRTLMKPTTAEEDIQAEQELELMARDFLSKMGVTVEQEAS